jgi:hypothetical protein
MLVSKGKADRVILRASAEDVRKMTAMASMRFMIGMCLEGELPPLRTA